MNRYYQCRREDASFSLTFLALSPFLFVHLSFAFCLSFYSPLVPSFHNSCRVFFVIPVAVFVVVITITAITLAIVVIVIIIVVVIIVIPVAVWCTLNQKCLPVLHMFIRSRLCVWTCAPRCDIVYVHVGRVNAVRGTEKGNVHGVKRKRLVSQFLGKTWKEVKYA